jgi:hypothetical protein
VYGRKAALIGVSSQDLTMARIISSLVMLWSLMQRVSANDDGDVSAQGQGSEIEVGQGRFPENIISLPDVHC